MIGRPDLIRIYCLLFVFFVYTYPISAASDELPVEVLQGRALDFYKEGKYSEAGKYFKKVIEKEPGNKRAKKFLKKLEDREAKRKNIQIKKGDHFDRATVYFQNREYEKAIKEWKKVLKLDSKHSESVKMIKKAKKKLSDKAERERRKTEDGRREMEEGRRETEKTKDKRKSKEKKLKTAQEKKTASFEKEYLKAEKLFKKKKYKKAFEILKDLVGKGYKGEKVRDLLSVSEQKIEAKNKAKKDKVSGKTYQKADKLFKKRKYLKAQKILKQILEANPSYEPAVKLLSKINQVIKEGKRETGDDIGKFKVRSSKTRRTGNGKKIEGRRTKNEGQRKKGKDKKKNDIKMSRKLCDEGENAFKKGSYKEAIDFFMQALIADSGNKKARTYIKMSSDEILRPRIKKINGQRQAMVFEARRIIFERQKKYDVKNLYSIALKDYKKKNYIRASEGFRNIMVVTAGYQETEKYFQQIENKMYRESKLSSFSDIGTLNYAQGYLNWNAKEIQKAVNEWEKYIALNPRNKEVNEYYAKAKEILEMLSRKEYQEKIEKKLKAIFQEGDNLSRKKKYVAAIRKYEQVISICEENPISTFKRWNADARLSIEDALDKLERMTAKAKKKKKVKIKGKEEVVIDVKSAQRCYTSGLVAYAQGRLREAIREWDLALRLNPHHEKAKLARQKTSKELGYK